MREHTPSFEGLAPCERHPYSPTFREVALSETGLPVDAGRKHKTIYGKTRAEVAKKLAKAVMDRADGLVFERAP
jgi:hypothetical protein